ncbi:hypothetical protein BCV70DRAFT_196983 [Testicularia cyperi]|uniref:BRCT domain-containing protein n=1 Tax=Testicularia cyperi TaxID=1882483 RepID=A0A317XWT3_9BASI|nr:hypothetical protein BCV70DRAFT_196983 [Testicularia cyperi]
MNRSARSHRSTKIPNVKLRPAARAGSQAGDGPGESSQTQRRRLKLRNAAQDDREADEYFRQLRDSGVDRGAHVDADFIGSSSRPLRGAVISLTGLGESKVSLTHYAKELGARVEGNLTEDVTHLIADRPGSEKYRFALELGMHIVSPDWITQVRERWLQGEDVDAEALQTTYNLAALQNTTVCFAGLSGSERRRLAILAQQLGATVSEELRFDGTITHLVSGTADPEASSSIHYVLHFLQRARQGRSGTREEAATQISVVRPEWLQDCQNAAGCLREQLYSVFAPLPSDDAREQLIRRATTKIASPFVRETKPLVLQSPFTTATSSSTRGRLTLVESQTMDETNAEHGSDTKDELITLGSRQKAAAAADKSFNSIYSQLRNGNNAASGSTMESNNRTLQRPDAGSSSLSAAGSSRSLAPSSSSLLAPRSGGLLGMSRASSFSSLGTNITTMNAAKRTAYSGHLVLPRIQPSSSMSSEESCFAGRSFKIRVADIQRAAVLSKVLRQHGGSVLDLDASAVPQYVLVDSRGSAPRSGKVADDEGDAIPVTHFWIEYCLHYECFVEPSTYFAAQPATVALPLVDGSRLRVLLIGMDAESPESYHARKLVVEIGGTVVEQLQADNVTHVVCATRESFDGRRAQRARSYGIPVVGLDFFVKARSTGELLFAHSPDHQAAAAPAAPGQIQAAQVKAEEELDGDTTLQGEEDPANEADGIAAPSSQTLIEEEQQREAEQEQKPEDQVDSSVVSARKLERVVSADEVVALLRSRALAQGTKKKGRPPPRFRKHLSDEYSGSAYATSPAPSFASLNDANLPPEQVLEMQARREAEIAAEAAAEGFSLGMEKDLVLPPNSQTGGDFDASIRVVYDDPAARRERNKLMKILGKRKSPSPNPNSDADAGGQSPGHPQRDTGAHTEQDPHTTDTEDAFGSGRRRPPAWMERKSESPTKRPVVRRQPLARR